MRAIFIVCKTSRESTAITTLCQSRGWPCYPCASLNELKRLLGKASPRVVICRNEFRDGYSDDIFTCIQEATLTVPPKYIVLAPADFSPRQEARQVTLGADCVMRDPVRWEVLLEYVAKYLSPVHTKTEFGSLPAAASAYSFAGARVFPLEHRLERGERSIQVTPREIDFLSLLARSAGQVLTYQEIYAELFSRNFSGDSSNIRVLLGKTAASFKTLDLDLRATIRVLPKTGYRYLPLVGKK